MYMWHGKQGYKKLISFLVVWKSKVFFLYSTELSAVGDITPPQVEDNIQRQIYFFLWYTIVHGLSSKASPK